jgi:hypothetical protein
MYTSAQLNACREKFFLLLRAFFSFIFITYLTACLQKHFSRLYLARGLLCTLLLLSLKPCLVILVLDTVALSFVFSNYYLIID